MIGRLMPLAECIIRYTEMRSVAGRVGPARQLWHPVWWRGYVSRCVRVCESPLLWLIWRRSGSVVGGLHDWDVWSQVW